MPLYCPDILVKSYDWKVIIPLSKPLLSTDCITADACPSVDNTFVNTTVDLDVPADDAHLIFLTDVRRCVCHY